MLGNIPDPAVANIVRFLITPTNALSVISRLSLVSTGVHSKMISTVKHADYYTKTRIIEFLRLSVLKSMHTTMMLECADHPLIDQMNTSMLRAHPYHTIRWLLFDTLERSEFDDQRAFFANTYCLPTFTNDFFEPAVERTRRRMVRFMKDDFEHPAYDSEKYVSDVKKELYKRNLYIGMRLQEKVPVVSKIGCSVYGTSYFKMLIPMLLEPFCALCLKRFTGRCPSHSFFCIPCNGVVIPSTNQVHDTNDFTVSSTLVKICKTCSNQQNYVGVLDQRYHCPLGINSCNHLDHSGGCSCPCHNATMTNLYSEYLGRRRSSNLFNANPYENVWSVHASSEDAGSNENSSYEE